MSTSPVLRLAHFSDLHLTHPRVGWRREDWFNKRIAAWLNLRFWRGWAFRRAEAVLRVLSRELAERRPGHLVFSGDASAMGFPEEAGRAAEILGVTEQTGLAVPGNHDYCTGTAWREECFEKAFAPWQEGRRIAGHRYPFAQRVGEAWLIGVNSSAANRWPWDATGRTGPEQLDRLAELLAGLEDGPRILVTHYPVARANRKPERALRRLRDLEALVAVATAGKVGLWLHGHRHEAYRFAAGEVAPFPVICAGSATQSGLWTYGEYEIGAGRVVGRVRRYDPRAKAYRDAEAFELALA